MIPAGFRCGLPANRFDFNRFDLMALSEIKNYDMSYRSPLPESCIRKERTFDWVKFGESFPEEMAKLVMKMKGYLSEYQAYLSREGAYRLSHPRLVALFEWECRDVVGVLKTLMRGQLRLREQVEAGNITPNSPFMDSPLYGRIPVEGYSRIILCWKQFEWKRMAVQFSTTLLLEIRWRESTLSEILLQKLPPRIVVALWELHEMDRLGGSQPLKPCTVGESGGKLRQVEAVVAKAGCPASVYRQRDKNSPQSVHASVSVNCPAPPPIEVASRELNCVGEEFKDHSMPEFEEEKSKQDLLRKIYDGSEPCSTRCS